MAIHESYYSKKFRDVVSFYKEDESAKQVEFIQKSAPLAAGCSILDLGCGYGRHCILLAKKGYCVTGYDFSSDYLAEAKEQAKREKVQLNFVQGDMRCLDTSGTFDVVLSLSTSLAFYDDETNADIFRRVYTALKTGGTFLFDQGNIFWLSRLAADGKRSGTDVLPDGREHHYRYQVDAQRCIVSKRSCLLDEGKTEESGWDLRYYTAPELNLMAKKIGFDVAATFGDYDCSPYGVDSKRLITIMKKS